MSKVVVLENQDLIDLCTQEYGSVEALVALCVDNGLVVDSDLLPTTQLQIQPASVVRKQVVSYLKNNRIKIFSFSAEQLDRLFSDEFSDAFA